ncbi:MAG: signal peptide peptidase SppA [Planctomycetes bacterium]|nr:signal peptide peptidase SppA [Planctomycetota bacterium]MBM4057081.1 signal peptide peptidase SppA [Planctomycetota bacterium]
MSIDQSPPTRVILEQRGGWHRWGTRLAWLIAGLSLLSALGSAAAFSQYFQTDSRVAEKYHSLSRVAADKVAIVSVSGAILGGDGFARAQLDHVAEDPAVKAIVLRIDSPGGTVSGSDEIHHRLTTLLNDRKLPVVVSMGGLAASGGYYVGMANGGRDDVIYAEPATLTGSIGVIIPHFDLSSALERLHVRDDSIASGPLKEMLSPTKERSPELAKREREVLESLVEGMFVRFKEIVKAGRPKLDDAAIDKVATGQIFTAEQARAAGLVDRIGFLEDAIGRAVELAGRDANTIRVVKYSPPKGLLDEVLGGNRAGASLANLAELATPRAWYLCSWWPVLVRSR